MKILIAEDEPAIKLGIIQLVQSLGLDIEIVGSADDGWEALEMMESKSPDVVITDIKMPGMSGLELIEKAKERYFDLEFVILSGFSEFDYAKKAMLFGVKDYILKPPRKEELRQTLDKLVKEHKEKQQRDQRQMLYEWIVNNACRPKNVMEKEHLHGYLFLACAGPFTNRAQSLVVSSLEWEAGEMEKQIQRGLQNPDICMVWDIQQTNEKLILLLVSQREINPIQRMIQRLSMYEKTLNMPIHLIISDELKDQTDIPLLYKEMRRSLGKQVLIGKSSAVFLEKEQITENQLAIEESEKRQMASLLDQDDLFGIEALFEQFCEKWQKKRTPQISCEFSVKYLCMEIYQKNPVLESQNSTEELFWQIEEVIGNALTFEEFECGIKKLLRRIYETMKAGRVNKKIEDVVNLLERYIHQHFNGNISLDTFARQYGYNPTYLSNQFTAIKQIPPNKMLTNLRLEKGKELLLGTDYLLKDIADMIGFHDVSYFSRFFKDNTGMSPRQFREFHEKK